MLTVMLIAGGLLVVTVVLHAAGFAALLRAVVRLRLLTRSGLLHVTASMVGLTFGLILIHLVDISVWGLFYFWQGCLRDAKDAFYFSGVTYSSLGYGDVVLPRAWRMLAPIETLTGILMCGLSGGLFFAAVSRWISNWRQSATASAPHSAEPRLPRGTERHR